MGIGQWFSLDVYMILSRMSLARDIIKGKSTLGGFIILDALFDQLEGVLEWQGWYMRRMVKAHVDSVDLYKMLNTEPIIQEKEGSKEFKASEGRISFKDLSFKHYFTEDNPDYDPSDKNSESVLIKEKVMLDHFDLEIEPGTTNAIVGPSGFGKTTLFYLLYRIYEAAGGKIFLDGQDISDLKFKSFRKYISMVP
jgi:ATP-binding cassette subfamily B protein